MNKKYTYILKGLDCANCARKIELAIRKINDYEDVTVNFSTSKLSFNAVNDNNVKNNISNIIKSIEPDIEISELDFNEEYKVNKLNLFRIIIGIIIGFSTVLINFNNNVFLFFIILSYIILLPRTFIKAIKILIRSKSLDENMLITISVIGAFLIGSHFEGFMVIALYEIGKLLEEMAVNKSKRSVKELMNIKPEIANLKVGNEIIKKNPEEINVNDLILIKIGERIPVDGIIVKGSTYLDTIALTGESTPLLVNIDDTVLSGSINVSDVIEVKVLRKYEDSTVSKILDLVENASNRKAKTENFVSRAAKIYTPIIIILAILTGILFPILTNVNQNDAIYRALSFLVISCPCAIAISVPLSYFSGIGLASKNGILVKGSDYLDNLRNIKTIVFDKTGTLTTGSFRVSEVISLNDKYSKDEIIEICAIGESLSNHPIAQSIINYYKKEINNNEISDYKEISGKGISFNLKNNKIIIGNSSLFNINDNENSDTVVYLSINNEVIGKILIGDEIKTTSEKTISILKKLGIKTIMYTGDNKAVAHKVGDNIGIDEIKAQLLPTDKYNELENIINNRNKQSEKIAFVGDGINDAPVLALADIGISMGAIGSSSAIESSDVVLMTDEVDKIIDSIKVSKVTAYIIKQNLLFSLGIKLLFVVLNLFGLSTMAWAVFADVGVTILAILNSLRILKARI